MSFYHTSTPRTSPFSGKYFDWVIIDELSEPEPKFKVTLYDEDGDEKCGTVEGTDFEKTKFLTAEEAKMVAENATSGFNTKTPEYPIVRIEVSRIAYTGKVTTPKPVINWS